MHSSPVLLSDPGENVTGFALAPDGRNVAYSTQSETFQNKIWLVNMETGSRRSLSDCANAICSRPIWSPDGTQIVYEYTALSGDALTGLPTLWWTDILTGDAKPVFPEGQLPGWNPGWSPDGKWLSYTTSTEIRLHNLENGDVATIPSTAAPVAAWSPDSTQVLYRDVQLQNNQLISRFFVYDLSSRTSQSILSDETFEDLFAVWSPDGEWIASARRDRSVPAADQIWVMRADGSEARMLTDTPGVMHNNLTWSPDGKYLLYDAYRLDSASLESDLQMIEVSSGSVTNLEMMGYEGTWRLP
jgi:TolB protein